MDLGHQAVPTIVALLPHRLAPSLTVFDPRAD